MAKNTTARDLMKMSFLRLGSDHTLSEALGILRDPLSTYEGPKTLIILDRDGALVGMVTIRHLLKALLGPWVEDAKASGNYAFDEPSLLHAVEKTLGASLATAMISDIPAAHPDDRLIRLMELMDDKRLDCIPVVDDTGRVLGIVYLIDVFNAISRTALSSEPMNDSPSKRITT
jgi:CBS domain-containing protein